MNLYSIQVAHKGTNGRLQILEQEFEGVGPDEALVMARAFYSDKIRYRSAEELLFSTPLKVEGINNQGARAVSIGGTTRGATIITGDGNVTGRGNVVAQIGKYNLNLDSVTGLRIGDD